MALNTTITPYDVAVVLGQPAPGPMITEKWEQWIADTLMFIQDRVDSLAYDESKIGQKKLDFVVREVVADQIKRRETDLDPDSPEAYRGRTVADWYPLLGLTAQGGAFAIDTVGTTTVHLPWCSSNFGALYCSCGADIAGTPIFEGGDDF